MIDEILKRRRAVDAAHLAAPARQRWAAVFLDQPGRVREIVVPDEGALPLKVVCECREYELLFIDILCQRLIYVPKRD